MAQEAARGSWRALMKVLWQQPLWAIPFGVFFGITFGAGWRSIGPAYLIALVFAYSVALSLWTMERFILPRTPAMHWEPGSGRIVYHAGLYAGTSIVGSFLAAVIVHSTLLPGFLGSARALAVFGMFTLLFTVLFSGLAYALAFYHKAIDRAKAEQELNLARRIQRSFLLSQFPNRPRIDVHAVNVSSKQVSGDFYDVIPAGDDSFLIAIADVAGKGVPAALLTSMLQASLRTQAPTVRSTAAILGAVNQLVYRSASVHQFATFFLARLDEPPMRLTYTNAGHNHPVVYRRDGARLELDRGGTVVGILESAAYEEGVLELAAGDRVVLYTDGISEAENAAGEQFGEERIHAAVAAAPAGAPAHEIVERLLAAVREFLAGVEPGDDMTLLVLRVLDADPQNEPAR
jgi:sigma-B regulation protein RsbU (phosphoserine phosphatase)